MQIEWNDIHKVLSPMPSCMVYAQKLVATFTDIIIGSNSNF